MNNQTTPAVDLVARHPLTEALVALVATSRTVKGVGASDAVDRAGTVKAEVLEPLQELIRDLSKLRDELEDSVETTLDKGTDEIDKFAEMESEQEHLVEIAAELEVTDEEVALRDLRAAQKEKSRNVTELRREIRAARITREAAAEVMELTLVDVRDAMTSLDSKPFN